MNHYILTTYDSKQFHFYEESDELAIDKAFNSPKYNGVQGLYNVTTYKPLIMDGEDIKYLKVIQ